MTQPPEKLSLRGGLVAFAVAAVLAAVLASIANGQDSVEHERARAAMAIALAAGSDEAEPDSDICTACNGKGETGDGRIMTKCDECNGTGKIRTGEFVGVEYVDEPEGLTVEEFAELQRRLREDLAKKRLSRCANPDCQCEVCNCDAQCKCGEIIEPPAEAVLQLPRAPVQIDWSTEQVATAGPRLPRILMLTYESCGPCRRVKRDSADLIGDASAGIEAVDVELRSNYAAELGIKATSSCPAFVVLDADGNETSRMTGYQSRATLLWLMNRAGVQQQTIADEPGIIATLDCKPSTSAALAAFAEHLARQQDGFEMPVGGLFDREIDAPAIVPELIGQLMAGKTIEIKDAGLSIKWLGKSRSLTLESAENAVFKPPATVSLTKWKLSISTTLAGIDVSDEGRVVRFVLKGPDLTVRFQQ